MLCASHRQLRSRLLGGRSPGSSVRILSELRQTRLWCFSAADLCLRPSEMGWFSCYLQKAAGAWKSDLKSFLLPGLRTSSLSPFYRYGRQGARFPSASQWQKIQHRCVSAGALSAVSSGSGFCQQGLHAERRTFPSPHQQRSVGKKSKLWGNEEPMGLEPAGGPDMHNGGQEKAEGPCPARVPGTLPLLGKNSLSFPSGNYITV